MDPKTDKQIVDEQAAKIDQLEKDLAALKEENRQLMGAAAEYSPGLKKLIAEKRRAGLDLATATQAAKNQLAWDKQQAEEAKAAKK